VARYTVKRRQEAELRADLREIRDAIDRYKDAADRNLIRVEAGTEGYPPDLETLVNGVDMAGQSAGNALPGQSATTFSSPFGSNNAISSSGSGNSATRHVRFLRKIPVDPMTGRAEWGMRSVQDDPDSTSWGGKDVFDVFSRSNGTALDGTHYADW
jgi:general secretion pathway protein G